MSGSELRFRTTDGVVTVHDDAIATRSAPREFLAGQATRWQNGNVGERVTVAFAVAGFLGSVVALVYHLYLVAGAGIGWSSMLYFGTLGTVAYSLWANHFRDTTIERSAISSVALDDEGRKLTLTHETRDGPLSVFRDDVTETEMTLGTDDDVRNAREMFRLRGIPVESVSADADATETEYRIVTKRGVCFCERCRSQVSPSHKVCPACEYVLWVETSEVD